MSVLRLKPLLLAIASCATFLLLAPPAASAAEGQSVMTCACDDMACWQQMSDEASRENFQCAFSSLSAAAGLASGGTTTAATVAAGIAEAAAGLLLNPLPVSGETSNETVGNFLDYVTAQCANFGAAVGSPFDLKFAQGSQPAQCLNTAIQSAGMACQILNSIVAMVRAGSVDANGITDILTHIQSGATTIPAVIEFAKAAYACLENGVPGGLDTFSNGVDRIFASFTAYITAARCGITLLQGVTVLLGNSYCLGRDLASLYGSSSSVSANIAASTAAPVQSGCMCADQALRSRPFSAPLASVCGACCSSSTVGTTTNLATCQQYCVETFTAYALTSLVSFSHLTCGGGTVYAEGDRPPLPPINCHNGVCGSTDNGFDPNNVRCCKGRRVEVHLPWVGSATVCGPVENWKQEIPVGDSCRAGWDSDLLPVAHANCRGAGFANGSTRYRYSGVGLFSGAACDSSTTTSTSTGTSSTYPTPTPIPAN